MEIIFKEEIINWSYELLTKTYGFNSDDLYVSVFEGDKKDKLSKDNEAYDMWSKIVPNEKIILGGKKTIFGRWVILVHVALAQKYILT